MERKRTVHPGRISRLASGAWLRTLMEPLEVRLYRAVASGRLTPEQAHAVQADVQNRLARIVAPPNRPT